MSDEYDVIVIGAGPVGENVAQYVTEASDLNAVLIEKELAGGECSYYACMPSKALLRPVEIANDSVDLQGISDASVQVEELLKRRDEWVSHYDDASQVEWPKASASPWCAVLRDCPASGRCRWTGERSPRARPW